MNGYYKLTANEIDKLSETAQDSFHLIYCFGKNNFVNIWFLQDPLQKKRTKQATTTTKKKQHCNLWSISNIFSQKFIFSQQ